MCSSDLLYSRGGLLLLRRRFGAGGPKSKSGEHGEAEQRTLHEIAPSGVSGEGGAFQLSCNDARSTSGFTCPAWYVFPLWTLVSHTSAGLNSSGSIL